MLSEGLVLVGLFGAFLTVLVVLSWFYIVGKINKASDSLVAHEVLTKLSKEMNELPSRVLNSVSSSSNNYKGNIGELIGYVRLNAEYDRIIPLGNITDFIGIVLPKNEKEGHIDFIDVKTGAKARLSKDQKLLRGLVVDKKIRFVTMNISLTEPTSLKS